MIPIFNPQNTYFLRSILIAFGKTFPCEDKSSFSVGSVFGSKLSSEYSVSIFTEATFECFRQT